MDTIKFNNKHYGLRKLLFPFGTRLVATTDLNESLFDMKSLDYVSEEARVIDESIYFFVESEQLKLDDEKLVDYILKNVQ